MIYNFIYVDLYECINKNNQTTQAGYQMQIIDFSFIYINKYIRGIKNLQRHKLIIQVLFCNAHSPVMACYLHYVTFPIIFTASMLPVCFVYSCRLASGKQTQSLNRPEVKAVMRSCECSTTLTLESTVRLVLLHIDPH